MATAKTDQTTPVVQERALSSLEVANKRFLFSEKLSDVTLEGSDGIRIPAHRMLLATRSPIFEKLLFGDFAEANDPIEAYNADRAVKIVNVVAAADYFEMSELGKKVADWACEKIREKESSLALSFFAAEDVVNGACPQIRYCAVEVLREQLKQNLDRSEDASLQIMSDSVLESILSDEETEADEIDLFRLAKVWSDAFPLDGLGSDRIVAGVRKTSASALVLKHIRFENISPLDLSKDVASSGLVSMETMCEAYRTHALAQAKFSPSLTKRGSYWGASK